MSKHEVILSFCIIGFEDVEHDYFTQTLGVLPIKQYFKGQPVNNKVPKGKISKQNRWIIAPPGFKKYDDFETQMNSFILLAKRKQSEFEIICGKYHCEFSCALFLEHDNGESTPWVHLGKDYYQIFGRLNVEFDLDLYV
jgi:hypothetical protein